MRLALCCILLTAQAFSGEIWRGRCIGIIDGSTISVASAAGIVDVRVFGVECPVAGMDFFYEAARFTHSLAHERMVEIETVPGDGGAPVAGVVSVDGKNLGLLLVGAGLGRVSQVDCRALPCAELRAGEYQARRDKLGIWSLPEEHESQDRRRLKSIEDKARKYEKEADKALGNIAGRHAPPLSPPPDTDKETPIAPTLYGDPKTKRVHRETCRHAKGLVGRIPFRTLPQAQDAGYIPCRLCTPR